MAIIKEIPDVTIPKPENPNLQPIANKTIAVDTKVNSLASLITHIAGYKWIVTYFSQYITRDDELATLEVNRPAVYQQYLRINDFEIRVSSPLNMSQNQETNETDYLGNGTIFAGVIPNVGDMFIADIGDGRAGVFKITDTPQLSILRDNTSSVEYKLVGYAENYLADLESKTVKTTWYVRDFVDIGKTPLLVASEVQSLKEIRQNLLAIPKYYYNMFFNQNRATFLVPNQKYETYDWGIVGYLRRLIPTDVHSEYLNLKVLNCDDSGRQPKTLLDALLDRDQGIISVMVQKARMLNCRSVTVAPRFSSIRYSGISNLYYPDIPGQSLGSPAITDLQPSKPRYLDDEMDSYTTEINSLGGLKPIIHPVTKDDYYVLSAAYYTSNATEQSWLETLVMQYIANQPLALDKLLIIAKSSYFWNHVEQFYYMPIVIHLLANAVGDIN